MIWLKYILQLPGPFIYSYLVTIDIYNSICPYPYVTLYIPLNIPYL